MASTLQGFARFCQLTLIVINIVAMVKSVEMTFLGATLLVLDPAFTLLVANVSLTSSDLRSKVTGATVLRLASVFFLAVGPVLLLVGGAGLAGAYRKSNGWLALYLGLLVALNVVILTLCACGFPKPFVDPSQEWRPLSDFLLTSVVLALAVQGVLIFLTIVLMAASAKEDGQVHPNENQPSPDGYRKNGPIRRPYIR